MKLKHSIFSRTTNFGTNIENILDLDFGTKYREYLEVPNLDITLDCSVQLTLD